MTEKQFAVQMQRLEKQFPNTYSQARAELIWREVGELDAGWWTRTVDELIGSCRFPPLMPEIREHIAREQRRLESKREHERVQRGFRRIDDVVQSAPETVRQQMAKIRLLTMPKVSGGEE